MRIGSEKRFLDPRAKVDGNKISPGPAAYQQSVSQVNTTFGDTEVPRHRHSNTTLKPLAPGAFRSKGGALATAERHQQLKVFDPHLESQLIGRHAPIGPGAYDLRAEEGFERQTTYSKNASFSKA